MSVCCLCGWDLRPDERDMHEKCGARYDSRVRDGICGKCGMRDAERPSSYCAQCESGDAPFRGYSEVY